MTIVACYSVDLAKGHEIGRTCIGYICLTVEGYDVTDCIEHAHEFESPEDVSEATTWLDEEGKDLEYVPHEKPGAVICTTCGLLPCPNL